MLHICKAEVYIVKKKFLVQNQVIYKLHLLGEQEFSKRDLEVVTNLKILTEGVIDQMSVNSNFFNYALPTHFNNGDSNEFNWSLILYFRVLIDFKKFSLLKWTRRYMHMCFVKFDFSGCA